MTTTDPISSALAGAHFVEHSPGVRAPSPSRPTPLGHDKRPSTTQGAPMSRDQETVEEPFKRSARYIIVDFLTMGAVMAVLVLLSSLAAGDPLQDALSTAAVGGVVLGGVCAACGANLRPPIRD